MGPFLSREQAASYTWAALPPGTQEGDWSIPGREPLQKARVQVPVDQKARLLERRLDALLKVLKKERKVDMFDLMIVFL